MAATLEQQPTITGQDAVESKLPSLPAHGRRPGLKFTIGTTIAGLAVAGCGIFGLNAGGSGKGGESQPPATPPPSVEVSDSPVPTPISSETSIIVVPTASPTEAPTPVPTIPEKQPDGTITWVASDPEATNYRETMTVADFNGIKAQLSKDGLNRIIFVDAKGEKHPAAEFKPNLEMQQPDGTEKQTGVYVVRADIVTAMTEAAHKAGQFQFAIPIDLRSQTGIVKVGSGIGPNASIPRVTVDIQQPGKIVEFDPQDKGRFVDARTGSAVNYEIGEYSTLGNTSGIIPSGQELDYIHLYSYGSDGKLLTAKGDNATGEAFTKRAIIGTLISDVSSGKISIGCYTATLVTHPIDAGNILTSGGISIAIAGN